MKKQKDTMYGGNSMNMKKIVLTMMMVMLLSVLAACGTKEKTITIYSCSEDYRIAAMQAMLDEEFPDLDIVIEYNSTGNLAAKILAEGKETDCDIIMDLENTYLEKLQDNLARLENVDFSIYLDELVPQSHKYVPSERTSGVIVVNNKMIEERNLPNPVSYDDLLKPEYKGLISMPNPKSSSTGYMFLLSMVNTRGEAEAFAYFDQLAENISGEGFTASSSGPIKALKLGEAAIGLCLTNHAVEEINNGSDYQLIYFEEGAPSNAYSYAVIDGKQNDKDIMRVFDYIVTDFIPYDKEMFVPEKIYKDKDYSLKNFPTEIKHADMTGIDNIDLKEELLGKWKY